MELIQTNDEGRDDKVTPSVVLGPYEKRASRIHADDLVLLTPPAWTTASRMLASVYWAGYAPGDRALAEHLLQYPRILQEVIRNSGRNSKDVCRICIPSRQGRWIGTGSRARPAYVAAHTILSRTNNKRPWELSTRSTLDGEQLVLALVR